MFNPLRASNLFTRSVAITAGFACLLFSARADAQLAPDHSATSLIVPPLSNISFVTGPTEPHTPKPALVSTVGTRSVDFKGWEYIVGKLETAGLRREVLETIFSDPRIGRREDPFVSSEPKEPRVPYRCFVNKRNKELALGCFAQFQDAFTRAKKEFGVSPAVVLSILQLETACGRNTGSALVFPRLLRLAAAATPENVERNIERYDAKKAPRDLAQKVAQRAQWLEDTFLPHVVATIQLAAYKNSHPLELRGSSAGALGMPQFLPGNYLRYGVDGDGDGKVDLFSGPDAVLSVANYLRNHGWSGSNPSLRAKRSSVWEYNRSQPYVDAVFSMASLVEPQIARLTRQPSQKTIAPSKEAADSATR